MANYNKKDNICATCTYWQGERTFKRLSNHIQIHKGEKAPCRYSGKIFIFKKKHAPTYTCEHYKEWNALK